VCKEDYETEQEARARKRTVEPLKSPLNRLHSGCEKRKSHSCLETIPGPPGQYPVALLKTLITSIGTLKEEMFVK
jgi:hypothetical protein